MTWAKAVNVALYSANWTTSHVQTVSNTTALQSRRIALLNSAITFFFFCNSPGEITDPAWSSPKTFNAGDAVFFRGQPTQYWNSTSFNSYNKTEMSVAYVSNATSAASAGCFTDRDGDPAVDVVAIFAANIDRTPLPANSTRLAPNVSVSVNGSIALGNPNVVALLQSGTVKDLQAKGITVLLTFLNNHDLAGWSQFATESDAQNFVLQLQYVVTTYGLDGIDIDDEYSVGLENHTSLAMVTSLMRKAMPGKIISKALYADSQDFGVPYNGVTLEQTLTYGWEMSYGQPPQDRLQTYVDFGMAKNTLLLGYWYDQPSSNTTADVQWLKANGYGGVMVYDFGDIHNQDLLGKLVDTWDGPRNWNKLANCP